jgi:hypothetical protein
MGAKNQPIEPRFWANVKKSKGCWEWTGCKMTRGYGQISLNSRCTGAHIVSVLLSGRVIPKGFVVMHTCDNKGCVNPDHLVTVPHKINMGDAKKKGLYKKRRLALAKAHLGKRPIAQYNYQAKLKRAAKRNVA